MPPGSDGTHSGGEIAVFALYDPELDTIPGLQQILFDDTSVKLFGRCLYGFQGRARAQQ